MTTLTAHGSGEPLFLFGNPHPGGVRGCPAPLPEPLEDVARRMDGQRLTVAKAEDIVKGVVGGLGASERYQVEFRSANGRGFVAVIRKVAQRVDCWNLIEYKLDH